MNVKLDMEALRAARSALRQLTTEAEGLWKEREREDVVASVKKLGAYLVDAVGVEAWMNAFPRVPQVSITERVSAQPCCTSCRFWEDSGSNGKGSCRRRAPLATGDVELADLWPTTWADYWCGEFELEEKG